MIYDRKIQDAFQTAVDAACFHAVRAVIRFEEETAGYRLNAVKRLLNGMPGQEDTNQYINRLYGDYKAAVNPQAESPWIRCPETLSRISSDVQRFGDESDTLALQRFLTRTREVYQVSPSLGATPLARVG